MKHYWASQKANWTDSDELAMMFRQQFDTNYYKQLHRHVHYLFRAHLTWHAVRRAPQKIARFLYYFQAAFISGIRLKRLEGSV